MTSTARTLPAQTPSLRPAHPTQGGTASSVDQHDQTRRPARDWLIDLAPFRTPSLKRSLFELGVTALPLIALFVAAWQAMSVSYWLTLALCLPAAGFLVRLFIIQHDCGHGAYFKNKKINDWVGRALGVFTVTPYFVWKSAHAIHHASSGNLDGSGIGAINTMTVDEYKALPAPRRFLYQLYRNPLVLFVFGPIYVFFIHNRAPMEFLNGGWRYWLSAIGTNLMIALVAAGLITLIGLKAFLLVYVPIVALAAAAGVWLFYVQHQFEHTIWARREDWSVHDAALYGSSYYDLPAPLAWLSGHIGIHHVHHLNARIPFYNLPKVLKAFPALAEINRMSLRDSLSCARLHLWDETSKRLVSFSEARRLPAPSAA